MFGGFDIMMLIPSFAARKVGNKSAAIELYRKRKTQVLQGEKLPEIPAEEGQVR